MPLSSVTCVSLHKKCIQSLHSSRRSQEVPQLCLAARCFSHVSLLEPIGGAGAAKLAIFSDADIEQNEVICLQLRDVSGAASITPASKSMLITLKDKGIAAQADFALCGFP